MFSRLVLRYIPRIHFTSKYVPQQNFSNKINVQQQPYQIQIYFFSKRYDQKIAVYDRKDRDMEETNTLLREAWQHLKESQRDVLNEKGKFMKITKQIFVIIEAMIYFIMFLPLIAFRLTLIFIWLWVSFLIIAIFFRFVLGIMIF